ncbi:hypothetical protein PHYSODRAFT_342317 [Phytophthora sojae]|uniref:Ankyrin repeat protein n=1 Tax=Phytophthora sojae (strain P6497) TaxID=1094619 RepID=G5AFY4_PHYSP|nr:hypothetical protein PHYSODRAFT_342317 [Phytophthora sojae]EGZ05500.1 hypothetical protein PHYSODRAFT_342317 [Phytophthora sojae]|eukprot:XP_009539031.1 hypothetical protein PHYSODRAFT_342317 [Phytophthora sojae]
MPSPLLVVELVLLHQQHGAALEDLGHLVADYLGPDRNLPLSHACNFGSMTLLDWMWGCSSISTTGRSPHWSLTNYLRSNPNYYQYQFHESMLAAAGKGDLRVIKWLMKHFSGCEVPVTVVEIAAERGRLDILQFLLEHDASHRVEEGSSRKKRKMGTEEGDALPNDDEKDGGNVVRWDGEGITKALQVKRHDIARFLYEKTPHGVRAATFRIADNFPAV